MTEGQQQWSRESLDSYFASSSYAQFEARRSFVRYHYFDQDGNWIGKDRNRAFSWQKHTFSGGQGMFTVGSVGICDAKGKEIVSVELDSDPAVVRLVDGSEGSLHISNEFWGAETTLVVLLRNSDQAIIVARWPHAPPLSRWLKTAGNWSKNCEVALSCALVPRVPSLALVYWAFDALYVASEGSTPSLTGSQ
jgi:hypothetical protein